MTSKTAERESPPRLLAENGENTTPPVFCEHRRYPRGNITVAVTAIEPQSQTELQSHTSDLSRGGCYLDTMSPLPAGTEIFLCLTMDGSSFHAKARVIHSQAGIGMGLSFTELAPEDRCVW